MADKQRQAIKNWPEAERPREKLIKNGAEALSDGELLAILPSVSGTRDSPQKTSHAAFLILSTVSGE